MKKYFKKCLYGERGPQRQKYSGLKKTAMWSGVSGGFVLFFIVTYFLNELIFFFFGSTACEILVPWPGTEPTYLALKVQGLNHWTTRQVLGWLCFKNKTSPSIVPGMFQDIHFTWSSHQRHKLGTISPLLQGQKTGSRLHQLKFIQLLSGGVRM